MHSVVNPWTACISQEAPARVVKLLSFGVNAGLALIFGNKNKLQTLPEQGKSATQPRLLPKGFVRLWDCSFQETAIIAMVVCSKVALRAIY